MTEEIINPVPIGTKTTILPEDVLAGTPHIYTEYIALSDLLAWPTNPKLHALEEINASMDRFGYTQPMLIDERVGRLVAGHGRREQLLKKKEAGEQPPLRIVAHDGEWYVPVVRGVSFPSDDAAAAYLLADNKLTEKGGWDAQNLVDMVQGLLDRGGGKSLIGTGFAEGDVVGLVKQAQAKTAADGSLLSLVDITIDQPKHEVQKGDIWFLGKQHILACVDVMADWVAYLPFLTPGALLVPYPGPFVPLSVKVADRRAVLVQPDPYIAGHILDRYADVLGEEALDRIIVEQEDLDPEGFGDGEG